VPGGRTSVFRPLIWVGSSKKDLLALPDEVIDTFGYALYLAQIGRRHEKTKVLRGFGDASVIEVIEAQSGNAFRAIYTVRFAKAVFVLHVFQKKSKAGAAMPKRDAALLQRRLKQAELIAAEIK
jgi:phage-related protein